MSEKQLERLEQMITMVALVLIKLTIGNIVKGCTTLKDKTEYQTAQETADLGRLYTLCGDLQYKLERHGFKIIMFQVRLAADVLARFKYMDQIHSIKTDFQQDNELIPGTIRVAALVQ
jgi:hypothetical protein